MFLSELYSNVPLPEILGFRNTCLMLLREVECDAELLSIPPRKMDTTETSSRAVSHN
jgi:hypothetical protein